MGQGQNLPASQNGLSEKNKQTTKQTNENANKEKTHPPLKENLCQAWNGLPWVCLVYIFFRRTDFLAKMHDGNNERRKPCCKPDFHV